MDLTKEEMANMSPEELSEIQKQNCIFCQIVSGKVNSRKVYEDDICLGILDINPANPGHIIILPKEHYAIMPQVQESDLEHMGMVIKAISNAALRAFKASGTNTFIANGAIAGQKAPHFMIHIIPRKDNDGLHSFDIPHKKISDDELQKIRQIVQKKARELFGIEEHKEIENEDKEEERDQPEENADNTEEKKPVSNITNPQLDDIANLFTGK